MTAFAILCHLVPGSFDALAYSRKGVSSGQLWRLLSGHLVHVSLEHIVRDGGVFLGFGSLAEYRWGTAYLPFLAGACLLISLAFYLLPSGPNIYVGLSSLIVSLCVCFLLKECHRNWKEGNLRPLGINVVALLCVVGKIANDFQSQGNALAFFARDSGLRPFPLGHSLGFLVGTLAWLAAAAMRPKERRGPLPGIHRGIAIFGISLWLSIVVFRTFRWDLPLHHQLLFFIPAAIWLSVVANSFR